MADRFKKQARLLKAYQKVLKKSPQEGNTVKFIRLMLLRALEQKEDMNG